MSSVYGAIKTAFVSGIRELNLPGGIEPSSIIKGKVARDRKDCLPNLPGIVVANYGNKASNPKAGTNLHDHIPYGIVVACLQASNGSQDDREDIFEQWNERICSKFRNQRLTGVPTVFNVEIVSDIVFDNAWFFKGIDASIIVFKVWSRELRG